MKTPHKHAEVIKAWADGHTVQFKDPIYGGWRDLHLPAPHWEDYIEWRIKPDPRKGWYRVALIEGGIATVVDEASERLLQDGRAFIRWLAPRTEYEVGIE